MGDREAVGSVLAGDQGGGGSDVERGGRIKCLLVWHPCSVGPEVHRCSGTCSTLTFEWGWLTSASALCRQPSCPPNSQDVPSCCPPLPPQLAPVLCSLLCPISSSVLLSVDDLWIFPPRFLVSRSRGWEGRALQKQFWSLPRLLLLPL